MGSSRSAAATAGLGVASGSDGAVDGHGARSEVDFARLECAGFLRPDAGQQGQHHVGGEAVGAGLTASRSMTPWLSVIAFDGRPSWPPGTRPGWRCSGGPCREPGPGGSPVRGSVDQAERPGGQFFGAFVEPVVQLVGGQLLELDPTDLRDHVVGCERAVIVDSCLWHVP